MSDNDYDVIIIGSGAGGGTLAGHLAPSGKRILLLERGDWLPREIRELGRRRGVRQEPLRLGRHLVRRARARRSSPGSTTTSAARPSSTARPCTGCGARTSASSGTTTASRPAWPISYDEFEPYYTRAEQLYEVHGTRGEDPTEPPASSAYPFPAVSHEPRIQQLSDDLERAGYHPFHAPVRRAAARRRHAVQPVHPLRDVRRLPVAGPGQVRRRDLRRPAGPRSTRTSRC